MDVETGAYKLLIIAVIGVALVIVAGISYTNFNNNRLQLNATSYTCSGATGSPCSIVPSNANFANAIHMGYFTNFTQNAGSIANTSASNANYAYYILFMALILGVLIGALVNAARKKQG